jgi:hypothetical protein
MNVGYGKTHTVLFRKPIAWILLLALTITVIAWGVLIIWPNRADSSTYKSVVGSVDAVKSFYDTKSALPNTLIQVAPDDEGPVTYTVLKETVAMFCVEYKTSKSIASQYAPNDQALKSLQVDASLSDPTASYYLSNDSIAVSGHAKGKNCYIVKFGVGNL